MYALARPLLMSLDAERAHDRALRWLDRAHGLGLQGLLVRPPAPLPTQALGLRFSNPVGLAAGLDKNGAHVDALFALGFGFVEVGTVTPRAQACNPLPRLFRVAEHDAIINRMGFNNDGIDALVRNVERSKHIHSGVQRAVSKHFLERHGLIRNCDRRGARKKITKGNSCGQQNSDYQSGDESHATSSCRSSREW